MKKILIILLISSLEVLSRDSAFVEIFDSYFRIGNQLIEKTIPINSNKGIIINHISGKSYPIRTNNFSLEIVFAGFGPAYGKKQNGENLSVLTVNDFQFNKYEIINGKDGNKILLLEYSLEGYLYSFKLNLYYEIEACKPILRKWLEISDLSQGIHFLDRINVFDMEFENPEFSHGEFGQPIFNNDIFLSVEYPAVENLINGRHLKIGYVVGEKITKDKIISFPSIIGVASSKETLESTFLDYVETIKVRGTRPFLLYNTWYDLRNPEIAESEESVMNEKNVLERINLFKKNMVDKHKIKLDAFVLDDGWDNYNSLWDIDTGHLPNKFTPFLKPLKELNTVLGIWASPFSGYSNREKRVKWGSDHGYERVGEFLCFAGNRYKSEFENKMVEYTKKFNIGYFKWDGFLLACNELNHGHLPGIYSRKALIDTYIHMMNAVREVNPDIFINITVGTWLSPWWLKYADCIWMQGEDYAYAEEVPSTNPREKSITYRDAVLYDNFQKQKLLFPMSSLMTHGIIKGRLNLLGGKDEKLESFSNEVMMYFGRGVMMWELYISPDLLTDEEWEVISNSLKWVKSNKDVLNKTKMILGNPLNREPYGYVHLRSEKGIIILRNPYVLEKEVNIKLDQTVGEMSSNKEYFIKIVYPYKKILSEKFKYPGEINLKLKSYEILVIELIPSEILQLNTPIGVRYDVKENGKIVLYGTNGSELNYSIYPENKVRKIKLSGELSNVLFQNIETLTFDNSTLKGEIFIKIPDNYKNSKLAILVEPEDRLSVENFPSLEVINNSQILHTTYEQENGRWFWYFAPLESGENYIKLKMDFKNNTNIRLGVWFFSEEILESYVLNKKLDTKSEVYPPQPYPSNVNKISINLKNLINH